MQNWIWLATIALVFFGITGVTQKLSTNNISFELSFLWFCAAFFVIAGAIAATIQLDWRVTSSLAAFAALGGLLNGLGALTSFAAFEKGGKAQRHRTSAGAGLGELRHGVDVAAQIAAGDGATGAGAPFGSRGSGRDLLGQPRRGRSGTPNGK